MLHSLRSSSSSSSAQVISNMIIHRTIESMKNARMLLQQQSLTQSASSAGSDKLLRIGFVPTMGALHDGHATLIRYARADNDIVISSIFINPKQFGPNEDLDRYPRSFDSDSALLLSLGVDHFFAPDADTMYGPNHCTYVDPMGFDETSEGQSRPGHFRGVATVVIKLLNIVQPTTLYLGQKDAAQCVMIRRIVNDLNLNVNIDIVATVRESDGLALSSRNAYLTPIERHAASILYISLCAAKELFDSNKTKETSVLTKGSLHSSVLHAAVESVLRSEPLVSAIHYISIDDRRTMRRLDDVMLSDGAIVSIACQVGNVRLIDNIILS